MGKLWEHLVGKEAEPNCAGGPCVSRCMSCRRLFVFFNSEGFGVAEFLFNNFGMIFAGFPSCLPSNIVTNCILKGVGQLAIPRCNGDAKRFERSMNYSFKPCAMARVLQLPHWIFKNSKEHFSNDAIDWTRKKHL